MSDDDRSDGRGAGLDAGLKEVLTEHFRAPAFPKAEVRERIRASVRESPFRDGGGRDGTAGGRARRPQWASRAVAMVAAVAASLLIFVGGAEYGRWSAVAAGGAVGGAEAAAPPAVTVSGDAVDPAGQLGLPISIQEAGSEYVSRLAQLTATRASLSQGDREMAEEVAWASLRGAATELARLSENSEALAELILMLEQDRLAREAAGTVIPF